MTALLLKPAPTNPGTPGVRCVWGVGKACGVFHAWESVRGSISTRGNSGRSHPDLSSNATGTRRRAVSGGCSHEVIFHAWKFGWDAGRSNRVPRVARLAGTADDIFHAWKFPRSDARPEAVARHRAAGPAAERSESADFPRVENGAPQLRGTP